jgi:hypothetical protein
MRILDEVNRSLSLLPVFVILRPQTASQGACSEIKRMIRGLGDETSLTYSQTLNM